MSFRNPSSRLLGYWKRNAASFVFKRPFSISLQRPLISFTFDDFPRSALLTGGAILKSHGLMGTYYVSLGLMGSQTPTGEMFLTEDLDLLLDQGHELGSHTFSHSDSWETGPDAFEKSVIDNRTALDKLFPGESFSSFSYPISLPRPLSKAKIAQYFLSCRAGGQETNTGNVDLNQLSAFFLEKSQDNFKIVRDIIDRNRETCGWLIFATHGVSDDANPFGCTPQFFENVVQYAIKSGAQIVPVVRAIEALGASGSTNKARLTSAPSRPEARALRIAAAPAKPLVSILIPAFNAGEWIADTLRSANAQTWDNKEIIVVDDGSTDNTLAIARQFESDSVKVFTQKNQGAAAARNTAYALCAGDYIQWLDGDDLLAPDKVERQMAVLSDGVDGRTLLSSEFGKFLYRWQHAQFIHTGLWEDLSPSEWLLRKMGDNLFMQTATWLVSRELSEASGAWDTRMLSDDDGEYFCRVLLNSNGTRFVPDAKVYYRGFRANSLAYVGRSNRKREALWLSMQLHINYLRSLEDTPRTRQACLNYIQRNLINFYPERDDIVKEAEQAAAQLGGQLTSPHLSWKYSWIKKAFGWSIAKNSALKMREVRWSLATLLHRLDSQIEKVMSRPKAASARLVTKSQDKYGRVTARSLARRPFPVNPDVPIISFSFDDFPRSALLTGGAILESYGLAGTYYASLGLMGKQAPTGEMFLAEDLQLLLDRGHELGCHTYSHCDARDTLPKVFEDSVIQNRRALGELMPTASLKTFSYPINVPRAWTKRRISKYFACCRCGGQTFNVGEADLNYLSGFFLEKGRDTPHVAKSIIDQNRRARGWLILVTHDVSEHPTDWGCTPEFFEEVVRYAVDSGARILPVFQAYEALRAELGHENSPQKVPVGVQANSKD